LIHIAAGLVAIASGFIALAAPERAYFKQK
jgi:hypothetical protein